MNQNRQCILVENKCVSGRGDGKKVPGKSQKFTAGIPGSGGFPQPNKYAKQMFAIWEKV
jgi:hypothetical protein